MRTNKKKHSTRLLKRLKSQTLKPLQKIRRPILVLKKLKKLQIRNYQEPSQPITLTKQQPISNSQKSTRLLKTLRLLIKRLMSKLMLLLLRHNLKTKMTIIKPIMLSLLLSNQMNQLKIKQEELQIPESQQTKRLMLPLISHLKIYSPLINLMTFKLIRHLIHLFIVIKQPTRKQVV